MTKLETSAVIWTAAFLSFELPPLFWASCPWMTLSHTVSSGIRWWHPIALMLAVFMFTLYGHFDRGWTWMYVAVEGALIALAILTHLLDGA